MHASARVVIGIVAVPCGITAVRAAMPPASYPVRPIRLVVPFAPGGTNDVLARIVGDKLGERLGQPLVTDNRAGAGSVLGTEIVARANPDGYTLLLTSAVLAVNPSIAAHIAIRYAARLFADRTRWQRSLSDGRAPR